MPVKKKEVVLDFPGYKVYKTEMTDIDSIPVHNKNGLSPDITNEQMIDLYLDEIYTIIKKDKVGIIAAHVWKKYDYI